MPDIVWFIIVIIAWFVGKRIGHREGCQDVADRVNQLFVSKGMKERMWVE